MKDSEEIASKYLESLGFSSIVYEPDGNVPPDFLVEGRIAVEVRRLNYNRVDGRGIRQGIETDQFALLRSIRSLLPEIGPPTSNQSWFVHYQFTRPLPPLKELKHSIKESLIAFRDGVYATREFRIANRFKLSLIPSTKVFDDFFVFGGYSDHDAGGWLVAELEKNIRICCEEKSRKIARARSKYPEWWLVLVDGINFGRRENLALKHEWNKVVLISPTNPVIAYEI